MIPKRCMTCMSVGAIREITVKVEEEKMRE